MLITTFEAWWLCETRTRHTQLWWGSWTPAQETRALIMDQWAGFRQTREDWETAGRERDPRMGYRGNLKLLVWTYGNDRARVEVGVRWWQWQWERKWNFTEEGIVHHSRAWSVLETMLKERSWPRGPCGTAVWPLVQWGTGKSHPYLVLVSCIICLLINMWIAWLNRHLR